MAGAGPGRFADPWPVGDKPILKPQCPLAFVVLAWLLYIGLIPVLLVSGQWLMLATWIVLAPALMWLYISSFPSISRFMGYGRVDDRPALIAPSSVDVTLYTALGCPFCPIVKRRLTELQRSMGFRLHEVDVTARPDVLIRKGIWSVPVVEARGATIIGHATSDQLANLISGRPGETLPHSSGFAAQH